MIDKELLAILACPACKGSLQASETKLRCDTCKRDYPVIDGIPDLVIS